MEPASTASAAPVPNAPAASADSTVSAPPAASAPSTPDAVEDFCAAVARNPSCRAAYRAALEGARTERPSTELADLVRATPTPASFIQDPQHVVSTLVHRGMLAERVYIDGEPYDGTPEQFAADENLDLTGGEVVDYRVRLTEAGAQALDRTAPQGALARLLDQKPRRRDGFLTVLNACCNEGGLSRDEVAAQLEANGCLEPDPRTGQPSVYPAYFIGKLEEAGAIVWKNKAWSTTEQGRQFLCTV